MEKRANIQRSPHFLLLQQQDRHGMCITLKNRPAALQPRFLIYADPAICLCGTHMTRYFSFCSLIVLASLCVTQEAHADTPRAPLVAGYGKLYDTPDAAFQPDSTQHYKLVFKVSEAASNAADINPGLNEVARVINLYGRFGVPANQLDAVVAVNGGATPAMLDEQHYRKLFGAANPNLQLIKALNDAGVKVTLCSQALAWHHYDPRWVASPVIRTPSALTTLTTLQNQGYALLDTQGAGQVE